MKEIIAGFGSKKYEIYIGNNYDSMNTYLDEHKINEKILIVSDLNVGNIYEEELLKRIKAKQVITYHMGIGESYKTIETMQQIYDVLRRNNFNRASAIIALGGGVVGDTAGFTAATFMRGMKFVQVPTTVIAAVDSSVGGKTGVNYKNVKNMVGSFYHPDFVYINTSTLRTLDKRQVVAGIAEIIKYAVLYDASFFNYLCENTTGLLNLESDKLNYAVRKCIMFKIDAVFGDEYDNGKRQLLNFGHTIGHVVESMSDYSLFHGEAVAIGMMFECILSNVCNMLRTDELEKVLNLINRFGLNRNFDFTDMNRVYELLQHDKKAERGNIKFILPDRIGNCVITSDIKEDKINKAFALLKEYWNKTI
ncbi:3-dehydroquinate synthase [Oxobacter pfennigii]|uniref:3-dehydroquinate synthase n=1 Tax=Oxobacter pfennigii TaxID=36849 RepID=A0A0P8WN72_9CLOT|nr:3-dehydroquinate synthase [Oxobacter pfennigii]KPU43994.1 3-dehydroquinate synthase [Oxobacter pfennigii]